MPIREAHCDFCQKPFSFYHAPSTKAQRYCSVRCRGRALSQSRQGWKMPPARPEITLAGGRPQVISSPNRGLTE